MIRLPPIEHAQKLVEALESELRLARYWVNNVEDWRTALQIVAKNELMAVRIARRFMQFKETDVFVWSISAYTEAFMIGTSAMTGAPISTPNRYVLESWDNI